MTTEDWTKEQLEALTAVTGEPDAEKAYEILRKDGTLIEKHRVLVEASAPKTVSSEPDYVVTDETDTTLPKHGKHKR